MNFVDSTLRALHSLWLLLALALGGCAHQIVVGPDDFDFRVEGKIGLVEGGEAYSARFLWRQAGARYDITLWGPLGRGGTRLRGDAQHLELADRNGEILLAGPPRSVMRRQLGWSLPLRVLPWWMSGQPAPDMGVEDAETDSEGRLVGFRQLGWQVRCDRFKTQNGDLAPSRITAERPKARIRVLIFSR